MLLFRVKLQFTITLYWFSRFNFLHTFVPKHLPFRLLNYLKASTVDIYSVHEQGDYPSFAIRATTNVTCQVRRNVAANVCTYMHVNYVTLSGLLE